MASSRRDTDAASVFAGVVGAPSWTLFAVVVVAAVVVVVSTPVVEGAQQGYWCINNTSSQRQQMIQQVLARQDAKIPPNYEDDFPTEVIIQLYIVGFDSISESTMDYSITVFLRQRWNDSRLVYPALPGVKALELDASAMTMIWVPDLYFTNEKKANFHDVTVPNKLMHIFPEGRVLYSARISMKLRCDMNLWKFPFDSQICLLIMESYGYSTDNLIYHWHDQPIEKKEDMQLPQFIFRKYETGDCTKSYVTGNYTCAAVKFYLERTYGYYLAQVYLPSILVVILSWVSFWLDIDAVPARISLGLLTVLTMTTQSASARSNLPRVSYIKALDVWMAICLLFVFAALLEFAYVNVNARVEKRRQSVHGGLTLGGVSKAGATKTSDVGDEENDGGKKRLFSKTTVMRQRARRVDKISRLVFPTVFVLFNLLYWACYMALED